MGRILRVVLFFLFCKRGDGGLVSRIVKVFEYVRVCIGIRIVFGIRCIRFVVIVLYLFVYSRFSFSLFLGRSIGNIFVYICKFCLGLVNIGVVVIKRIFRNFC